MATSKEIGLVGIITTMTIHMRDELLYGLQTYCNPHRRISKVYNMLGFASYIEMHRDAQCIRPSGVVYMYSSSHIWNINRYSLHALF